MPETLQTTLTRRAIGSALILLFWAAMFGALPGRARADGCYMQPITLSVERLPALPRQRALLVYDSQATTETLVIESVMSAEKGDRFAWLLPLPAAPTVIKAAAPSVLDELEDSIKPNVEYISPDLFSLAFPILVVMFLYGVALILFRQISAWLLSATALLILVLVFLYWPIYGTYGYSSSQVATNGLMSVKSISPSSPPPADVLYNQRVGNYQVAVLKGANHQTIADWLQAHKFAKLPPRASWIIDDYCRKGWVLLAADLVRPATGESVNNKQNELAAHPLRVTFSAREPVYPMRLTALGQSQTDVRLFTFSREAPLTHRLFRVDWANHARGIKAELPPYYWEMDSSGWNIVHPGVAALVGMQDGWLCRLQGQPRPEQMNEDYILRPESNPQPRVATYYTPEAANWLAWELTCCLLLFAPPAAGFALRSWRRPNTTRRSAWFRRVFGESPLWHGPTYRPAWSLRLLYGAVAWVLISFMIGGAVHVRLPKIMDGVRIGPGWDLVRYTGEPVGPVEKLDAIHPSDGETTESVARRLSALLEQDFKNVYTWEPLRRGINAGDYTFIVNKGDDHRWQLPPNMPPDEYYVLQINIHDKKSRGYSWRYLTWPRKPKGNPPSSPINSLKLSESHSSWFE